MKKLFIIALTSIMLTACGNKQDNTIVLYLQNATATISSFTSDPETFTS